MILLPSRGRPKGLDRFFQAYRDTGATAPGLVLIEGRDWPLYLGIDPPVRWGFSEVEPSLVGRKFNRGVFLTEGEDRYFVAADDLVPETRHWDARLAEAAGDWGVAYGRDFIQDGAFPTHPCVGGKLVRALGWIAYPGVGHFYWDNVLGDVARALGTLAYLPDVVTRHLHFTVTGVVDAAVNERGSEGADRTAYDAWRAGQMATDIARVRAAMGGAA